jgi:hypothetical protein
MEMANVGTDICGRAEKNHGIGSDMELHMWHLVAVVRTDDFPRVVVV